MFVGAREAFGLVVFREVVIEVFWSLWKHINDIVFDGASVSFSTWKALFLQDLKLVMSHPILRTKSNASHMCSRIKFTYMIDVISEYIKNSVQNIDKRE